MYSGDVREAAVAAVRSGLSAARAAKRVGASGAAVEDWCAAAGVTLRRGRVGGPMVRPAAPAAPRPPRPSARSRLTLEDRVLIEDRVRAGRSAREIGRELGFSHTTVSRELSRGAGADGRYRARAAHRAAGRRASRPRAGRLGRDPRLRAEVLRRLAMRRSPEQVSASLRRDFPGEGAMRVSHETIYRALYVQGRGSLRQELRVELALRTGRRSRRPRSGLPEARGRRSWVEGAELALRPPGADGRAVPGHWEGDLVVGRGGRACLVTLAGRSTRFLLCPGLDAHEAGTVAGRLAEMVSGPPAALSRTLTWDQGVEMASWRSFADATGFDVHFCDPRSPWQRGTNENTNGLLRQYFPKGTDFSRVSDAEVRAAADELNGRPRKTLGWRSPAEAMAEVLDADGGAFTG